MKQTLFFFIAALSVAMFSSCAKQGKNAGGGVDSTAMASANTAQTNMSETRAFYENVMNKHDTAAADKYCAANFVDHNPAPGHSGQGLDDLKKELGAWFAEMPDVHFDIDQMSADSNLVWLRYTVSGTMKGDMGPMKATNKSMKIGGIDEIKIQNGKASDRWGYEDDMAMMSQLGLMPPPPGKK
ncbi:MAG: ester cyclase [Candidatus Kapaibacterium sp.]